MNLLNVYHSFNSLLAFYHNVAMLLIGDPNAVNDIISNPMFAGSLESLSKVIQVCDSIFGFIVSFAGFFIISAAMLRNVIAGMYASNTKLFDKVNEVKNNWITGIDGKTKGMAGPIRGVGTVGVFMLRMLPDPKELSEFKDDTIEPRDYFLKAIPQMIGVVMIGVVIYNGYYKDLLGKAATLGSNVIERFILDVDPVEGLNKLLGWASQPELASKEDESVAGKLTYDIAYDMYHQIVTFYTDQTELNAKNSIATTLDSWASTQVTNNCVNYMDDTKWKYSVKVDRVLNQPNLAMINKTGDEQVIQAWSLQVASMSLDTKYHKNEDWWIRVIVVFDRVRENSVTSTGVVTDGELRIPNGSMGIVHSNTYGDRTRIKMDPDNLTCFRLSGAKLNGAEMTIESDGIYIQGDVQDKIRAGTGLVNIYYTKGSNSASLRTIKINTNNTFQVYSSKGTITVGQEFQLSTSGSSGGKTGK